MGTINRGLIILGVLIAHCGFTSSLLFANEGVSSSTPKIETEINAQEVKPAVSKKWNFNSAALLPIQNGGRVKPLDSFARETILFVTGSRTFKGWDPVEMLLSWIAEPYRWQGMDFIRIDREDVKRQIGLDVKSKYFSPKILFHDSHLGQYADEITARTQNLKPGEKLSERDQELKRVLDRLMTFRAVVSGELLTVLPAAEAAPDNWQSLLTTSEEDKILSAGKGYQKVLEAFHRGVQSDFDGAVLSLIELSKTWGESVHPARLKAEVIYSRYRPFMWAWIFYFVAGITLVFARFVKSPGNLGKDHPILVKIGFSSAILAFLLHSFGFALRCYVAGRPPVTNMYESIVWVGLGTMFFAGAIYISQRQNILITIGATLSALCLIVADAAPSVMDPGLHPLVPVLRSNYWLTIHVLTITLGYAALALTLGIANVTLFEFFKDRAGASLRIQNLNQLTYRAMQFGVVLLAAGTILGGVWADYSWGRFWGWDPKEVWALIALLGYVAILHMRYTNWVGQFGFAAWSVISFLLVVMAWYGVNFVLGVGLHSYGFASGGQGTVAIASVIQIAWVTLVAIRVRSKKISKKTV